VLQLFELALADVGAAVGRRTVLHEPADGLDASGLGQFLDLGQLAVGVGALR
jgi:hypothetical protein